MPSPFPGMDPYLESQYWQGFHTGLLVAIQEALVPRLRPRCIVLVEQRVYLEYSAGAPTERQVQPDVLVAEGKRSACAAGASVVGSATLDPIEITLPKPEHTAQRYLTIRTRDGHEVVTVIEVLSPANKRAGSDARAAYMEKRDEKLQSNANLVEIDLLRGGTRMPTAEPFPPTDYCAVVSRASLRPRAMAYAWSLRQPLPSISVPLATGEEDVPLDLQTAFTATYDRGGYDYSLDYTAPLEPTPAADDAEWAASLLVATAR